jgi:hypothetical protein
MLSRIAFVSCRQRIDHGRSNNTIPDQNGCSSYRPYVHYGFACLGVPVTKKQQTSYSGLRDGNPAPDDAEIVRRFFARQIAFLNGWPSDSTFRICMAESRGNKRISFTADRYAGGRKTAQKPQRIDHLPMGRR